MKKSSITFIACLFTVSNAFAGVPNDFDGDGISDRTWVTIESDKTLTWKAEFSSTRSEQNLGSLGKAGDAIIMAQWLGSGTQIGVASLNETTGDISWVIQNADGTTTSKVFGKRGDVVVSGADFDGNGVADAAVVRLQNNKAVWYIAYDLFASSSPVKKTVTFGQEGDRVFYARATGTSAADWIGVMRQGQGGKSLARMMNLVSGSVKQFARLPKFASEGTRPRAFPIRQDSGPDLVGFMVPTGGQTSVKVFELTGVATSSAVFAGSGTSIVGEYLQGSGFEIVYENGEEAVVLNPREIDLTETVPLGGVPVDEININSLGATVSAPPPSDDNGGGGSGGGTVASCSSIRQWPSSHIYKTVGSKHFSDVRRNTIGVIIKSGVSGPFPSCINAVDKDGRVVAKLGLYAMGAGWSARYYAGIGCGNSTPFNGATVADKARAASGSSTIYMNFAGVCYGPLEASKCRGSTSC